MLADRGGRHRCSGHWILKTTVVFVWGRKCWRAGGGMERNMEHFRKGKGEEEEGVFLRVDVFFVGVCGLSGCGKGR